MVPATAKGEATRAFLLRTAAQVFAERGYPGTALTDLIAASGLTKGAFYFYFQSKSALALAVLRDQQDRWLRQVRERVLSAGTAIEQFQALAPSMLDLLATEPGAWSITRRRRGQRADDDVGRPHRGHRAARPGRRRFPPRNRPAPRRRGPGRRVRRPQDPDRRAQPGRAGVRLAERSVRPRNALLPPPPPLPGANHVALATVRRLRMPRV
jgi:AcrR family transcriptional regulator